MEEVVEPVIILGCRKCHLNKPSTEFHNNKRNKSGKDLFCKPCRNESNNKNKKTNIERRNEKLKKYLVYKLSVIKEQDKKKFPDHEFTLTEEDLFDVYIKYDGICVYSRKNLKPGNKINIYSKISYDRINNNLPHTKENLQLTSVFMNMMRSDRTTENFQKFIAQFD